MDIKWQRAEDVKPEIGQNYLVWTNGQMWRDSHLHLWPAPMLQHHMKPEIVRGRPLFVAKIVPPIGDILNQ